MLSRKRGLSHPSLLTLSCCQSSVRTAVSIYSFIHIHKLVTQPSCHVHITLQHSNCYTCHQDEFVVYYPAQGDLLNVNVKSI